MIRYCKQPDDFSCGPVAIINAMKWRGQRASVRTHLKMLRKQCKTDRDGTFTERMDKVLRQYVSGVEHIDGPSLKLFNKYIDLGHAVIISYAYTRNDGVEEGHFAMCIGRDNSFYTMVNDTYNHNGELKSTVSKRTKNSMKNIFANAKKYDDDIEIWIL